MDENLSRGYVQLGKARGINDFKTTNGFNHLSPPVDKCNFIYLALVVAGVGFLMPYNRLNMKPCTSKLKLLDLYLIAIILFYFSRIDIYNIRYILMIQQLHDGRGLLQIEISRDYDNL